MYILTGFDDFIWDLVTVFKRITKPTQNLEIKVLDSEPPKLIALIVAAWHEENVLFDVIENIIVSQHYPKAMYHIFLGVYPNDDATIEVARELEKKYKNINCIINSKQGPTSKAQNINYVISRIKAFEKEKGWEFAAFTIHDSEDLVHPYELKVTNYLINQYPALQFPVFPLIKKPTLRNFFQNITTNTYADEFAENHFITMVGRHKSGAFVPSAGTGFSLSRKTVEGLGESVLPENSLTEDYRLSLTLYEKGIQMYYVLEKIKRYNCFGQFKWDFIATRSMFPNTFRTAVKQKTRWTLGITMQSFRMRDLFKNNIPFIGRYSLYRDQKAKIGNILSAVGYPVLIYFLASLFFPLVPMFPKFTFSWYLSLLVTLMMIERQLFRGIALLNVYGLRSAFFGCLLPPVVPIRIVWGNIINLVSTVKAYFQFFHITPFKSRRKKAIEKKDIQVKFQDRKFDWAKTEHSFLEKEVLSSFHRKLGDILVEKGFISPEKLKEELKNKVSEIPIGSYLVNNNTITESQLMESLAAVKHVPFLREESLKLYDFTMFSKDFDKEFLEQMRALPLIITQDGYIFAYSDKSPIDAQSRIREKVNKKISTVLATDETIKEGLQMIWFDRKEDHLGNKFSSVNCVRLSEPVQIVIIKNYASMLGIDEREIVKKMGIIPIT